MYPKKFKTRKLHQQKGREKDGKDGGECFQHFGDRRISSNPSLAQESKQLWGLKERTKKEEKTSSPRKEGKERQLAEDRSSAPGLVERGRGIEEG